MKINRIQLQGFMDYTPGGFNNVTKEEFVPRRTRPIVMGTRAHHFAMYVVFDVPFRWFPTIRVLI